MQRLHHRPVLRLIGLLFFSTFLLTASAASFADVFYMHRQDGGGDCRRQARNGKRYDELLEAYWKDSAKLVGHAVKGISKYNEKSGHGQLLRDHFQSFFGILWDRKRQPGDETNKKRLEAIIGIFSLLDQLFKGEYQWDQGWQQQQKRQIFCNSDWIPETTSAYNKEGNKLTKQENGEELDINIHNKEALEAKFPDHNFPKELFEGTENNRKIYAHWSEFHKRYIFETITPNNKRYKEADGKRHYCNGQESSAGIGIANTDPSFSVWDDTAEKHTDASIITVTFCKRSFSQHKADTSDESERKEGNKLSDVQPHSLTLLHELVHVIIGPDNSPDAVGDDEIINIYGPEKVWQAAVNAKNYDLSNLPEAYAFFAFAYMLSTNDEDGDKFDWTNVKGARKLPTKWM